MSPEEVSAYSENVYAKAQKLALETVQTEIRLKGLRRSWIPAGRPDEADYIPGDVCGCATIRVKGNSSFGRWARKYHGWCTFDPPGLCANDYNFGQSYEKNLLYAQMFVAVLQEAGIGAWYTPCLD
jgi:hypothetical protein